MDRFELTRLFCSSGSFSRGIVVQLANGKHRVYLKGASEILLKISTKHLIVSEAPIKSEEIEVAPFDEETRQNIDNTIILYANNVSSPSFLFFPEPNSSRVETFS